MKFPVSSTATKIAAVAALVAANGTLAITSAHAQASTTQPVNSSNPWDYNLYTFGNANSNGSTTDIAGRVAIGGTGNFSGFSLASNQAGSSVSDSNTNVVINGNYTNTGTTTHGSVDVGGNANITNPTINGSLHANGSVTLNPSGNVYGSVTYGTTYSNGGTGVTGTATKTTTTLPIDFTSTDASLTSMSASLASLTNTATVSVGSTSSLGSFTYNNAYGSGTLTYTGSAKTAVFDMTAAQFNQANYGWTLNAGSATSIIINVTGGTAITLQNGQMNLNGISANGVLFNFTDATSIYQNSYAMYGSVLATKASFTGAGGQFNGSMIVNTFDETGGGTELHNYLYSGYMPNSITPPAVPEPGMYVTAFSMVGMTGLGMVRGRRRARKTAAAA